MIQQFADWLVYGIFGLDADTPLGTAVNFFFYDSIKIIILLFSISFVMGIINAYFPIERLRQYLALWLGLLLGGSIRWYYPVLLLLICAAFYRLCQGRNTFGRNSDIPYCLAFS